MNPAAFSQGADESESTVDTVVLLVKFIIEKHIFLQIPRSVSLVNVQNVPLHPRDR